MENNCCKWCVPKDERWTCADIGCKCHKHKHASTLIAETSTAIPPKEVTGNHTPTPPAEEWEEKLQREAQFTGALVSGYNEDDKVVCLDEALSILRNALHSQRQNILSKVDEVGERLKLKHETHHTDTGARIVASYNEGISDYNEALKKELDTN